MLLASLFVNEHLAAFSRAYVPAPHSSSHWAAAGLLAQFTHAPPIFVALVASLVAAGMAFALAAQDPFDSDYSSLSQLGAHVVSFLAAISGFGAL